MRSFRAKPVGWQRESYRHSLAARGYTSKKQRYNSSKVDRLESLYRSAEEDREKSEELMMKAKEARRAKDAAEFALESRELKDSYEQKLGKVVDITRSLRPGDKSEWDRKIEEIKGGRVYSAFKEEKGIFKADTVEQVDKELRQQNVNEMANESVQYLQGKEDSNRMNSEWTERFMQYEFKDFANRYLNDPMYTRKQFQEDVRNRVRSYAQTHSGTLSAFDWAEEGT